MFEINSWFLKSLVCNNYLSYEIIYIKINYFVYIRYECYMQVFNIALCCVILSMDKLQIILNEKY